MTKTRGILLLLLLCGMLYTLPAQATDACADSEVSGLVVTISENGEGLTAGDVEDTPEAVEEASPLTPEGNLNLVDDTYQIDGTVVESSDLDEKQFITIQSKNGNYFYIVIDRNGDQDNVHFLNQVDEADLMALMEDNSEKEEAPVCICTDKCAVGNINISCPVCRTNMSECTGKEAEPEPSPELDAEPEKEPAKAGSTAPLLIVLVLAMAGGGAVYYFKFRKPKIDTKGPVDLDDYDFGEDEDEDYEYEKDDADEPEARGEGD